MDAERALLDNDVYHWTVLARLYNHYQGTVMDHVSFRRMWGQMGPEEQQTLMLLLQFDG